MQLAFDMCDGVSNAIQPTHGDVITAIVILPTASGDFVKFPPLTTTTEATTKVTTSTEFTRTTLPTTLVTDTRPPPTTNPGDFPGVTSTEEQLTSTRPLTTSRTTSVTTIQVSSETSGLGAEPTDGAGDEDDDGSSGGSSLNKGQIAGISVGVAAAAAVAIGAIVLARYCRHRRRRLGYSSKSPKSPKGGFLPMRETWGYRPDGTANTRPESWLARQLRPSLSPSPFPPPPAYHQAGWEPGTTTPLPPAGSIGLAISQPSERDDAAAQTNQTPRRASKLLPARPSFPPIFAQYTTHPLTEEYTMPMEPATSTPRQQQQPQQQQRNLTPPAQAQPAIVLQVSPPRNTPPSQDKPIPPVPLKLTIPTTRDLHKPPPARANTRDSETTEFEEDGGQSTALSPSGGLVWRPPSAAPASAAPYYVADRNGNWVLADSARGNTLAAEIQTPISPPEIRSAQQVPIVVRTSGGNEGPRAKPAQQQQQQHMSLAPPGDNMRSQASSVYSQQSAAQPQPLFSGPFPPRQQPQQPQPQNNRRSLIRVVSNSSDGDTTTPIESSSGSDPSPPEAPGALSPVMESPSREGRGMPAPMPPARNARRTQYFAPPPARGTTYFPPGQPSPTLGNNTMQRPSQQGQGMASTNVPNKGRRLVEDPAQERTGSPTLRVVEPSPEPEEVKRNEAQDPRQADARHTLPSARARNSVVRPPPNTYNREPRQQQQPPYQSSSRMSRPPSFDQHRPYPMISPSPFGPYPQYQRQQPAQAPRPKPQRQPRYPPQQQQQQQQPPQRPPRQQPYPIISHARNQTSYPQPPPPMQDLQSPVSVNSAASSAASSLMARRLGAERAAQMNVPTDQRPSQWHREYRQSLEPPGPGGRHGSGSGSVSGSGSGSGSAPGWGVPRMTPTRRGGELFLNVHV